jgi:hypothetical protein
MDNRSLSSRALGLVGVGLLVAAFALWLVPRSPAPAAARVLASPTLTPGVVNPDVTDATISSTICKRGWTRTIRPPTSYTSRLKVEQLRLFGLPGPPSDYQEDHLISLELGGHPTDPRNLWPEPRTRAEEVDELEDELRRRVCDGSLPLRDAQRRISEVKHRGG